MKYCKYCGSEIEEGKVCSCAEAQNESVMAISHSGKRKNLIIILVAVIVVIAVVIGIFSGGGYKKPVDNFFTGLQKCSVKTIAKSVPKDSAKELKETMTDENLESLISLLEIGYGKNLKISYDIDDKTKLKNNEIEKLEKKYGVDIKKAYDLKIEITFKGKNKKEDSDTHMTVADIKGEGWKLIGEDVSDLF